MSEKLTKAQRELLRSLAVGGRYHIQNLVVTKNVVSMGLAESNKHGCTYLTPAGLSALQAQKVNHD